MRVLIADDDRILRHLLLHTLQHWGHEVTSTANGHDAWAAFSARDYSVVISDWEMPGLDGLQLVHLIRATERPGYVFVILLTAHSDKDQVMQGLEAGADDFLVKPFDREELRIRLRTAERVVKLEQTLLEQNRLLLQRNARMEEDLRMACEVQQALLPQGYPSFPQNAPPERSLLRFCDRYQPNGAVGGDFFDVLPLSDHRAGLFICDVMGHGVRAALVTAIVRALVEGLRSLADEAGRFLSEMNRELLAILGPSNVPVFLAAFYGVMDTRTGEFTYASAGHPNPLHVRRGQGETIELQPPGGRPGPPLGVRQQASYAVGQTGLEVGDLMVFFTDGLYEVTGIDHEPFGEDRLRAAVNRRRELPAGKLFDELLADVQIFADGRGFADDVCLLGMEVMGRAEATS